MMPKEDAVKTKCCGTTQKVVFDELEAPHLPPGEYRQNVFCQSCETLVILHLRKDDQIDQEII